MALQLRIVLPRKKFSRLLYIADYFSKYDGVKVLESSIDKVVVEYMGLTFRFDKTRKLLVFVMKNNNVFYFRAFDKYFQLCKWIVNVFEPTEKLSNHKVVLYANKCRKRFSVSLNSLLEQSSYI